MTATQRRKGPRPDGTVPRNEALRAATKPTWTSSTWTSPARGGKGKEAPRIVVEWRESDLVETYPVEPEHDEVRLEELRIG